MKLYLIVSLIVLAVAASLLALVLAALAQEPFFTIRDALLLQASMAPLLVSGLLILRRQPHNRIGRLVLVAAFGAYFYVLAVCYATYAPDVATVRAPLALAATWFGKWGWITYVWPITVGLPLFFPTGRVPSPRWRLFLWYAIVYSALMVAFNAFYPGPIADLGSRPNPLGVPALGRLPFTPLQMEQWFLPVPLLAITSLLLRFHRSRGEERAQIKWFFYATVVFVPWLIYGTVATTSPGMATIVFLLIVTLFGAAITVAILRYRLYDIDVIIRRTLSYSLLTALLALIYWGLVVVLEGFFASLAGLGQSQLAVVLSTLAIAVLFLPLRARVQDFIDRRFYRRKYDAQQVLNRFAAVARDETDLEQLAAALLDVIHETVQPVGVSLWLDEAKKPAAARERQRRE